ncbi:MAG: sulfatase [Planctomyces sp.]|nr:sulfatase [Planctomyces sp.]
MGRSVTSSLVWFIFSLWLSCHGVISQSASGADHRPNILFLFADDWGRFAGRYAELNKHQQYQDLLKTPNFDAIASRGVLFRNAHVNAPSCTPCRSSILSGQYFWRTGRGAILQGAVWDPQIPVWPLALRDAGYHIGKSFKVWSPGTPADAGFGGQQYSFQSSGGRINQFSQNLTNLVDGGATIEAGKVEILNEVRQNFGSFLDCTPDGSPFCFWFGPTNVHRKWTRGSGARLWGLNPDQLAGRMPGFLPDVPEVREDLADYFGEVMAFDAAIGVHLEELSRRGLMENTLIIVSGDHGAPGFPHGKCNLYDFGTGVALAVAGPGVHGCRVVDDFVNLPDLAPTILEAAGLQPPDVMTGRTLWPVLRSDREGQVDPERTWVVTGRERHVEMARAGHLPYPQRCLRTSQYSYIINFKPERTPLGDLHLMNSDDPPSAEEITETTFVTLPDEDAGPAKAWFVMNRNNPEWSAMFEKMYGLRPREELYHLELDPDELNNLAGDPAFEAVRMQMERQLLEELQRTGDPRLVNDGEFFETPPMAGPIPAEAGTPARQRRRKN